MSDTTRATASAIEGRRVVVNEFVTLDGYMVGPDEDMSWAAEGFDPQMQEDVADDMSRTFDLFVFGRVTYDIFAAHWPHAEGGPYDDIARTFNRIAKYVATRRGVDLTWKGSVELREGAKDVAKLKLEGGPALVTQGSTELVHSLLAAGLVDEIRTFTFPVLLGRGKRLFDDSSEPRAFKLTHSAVSSNGLIHATYVRDGEVQTATVGGERKPSTAELARREKLKREG